MQALPFYADSTLTPVWTADTAALHRVSPFALVDQDARRVDERALDGRITVAVFFYATCKDLCPRLESKLAQVRAAYSADPRVQLVSISVAPQHDSAQVLAAYAAANHISAPAWRLLTGDATEVARVAHASFFADAPAVRGVGATHGETIWLLDPARRIRGLYNGTMPLDTKRLIEDIATLTRGQ
jgi:protein SCO1/2